MSLLLSQLTDLRRELHRFPELSNHEKHTATMIKSFVSQFLPDEIIENIGNHGIAFIYKGKKVGPTVMFRCELDALPILEINSIDYMSTKSGVSHKCGHDGHMAIVCGLAQILCSSRPDKGRVILLFQPAEETGQGAKMVINDPKFNQLIPNYVFALHNIPGYPINSILVRNGVFSSASIGLKVRLNGITSHASEPEKGQNPAYIMANIIKKVERYCLPGINPHRIKLITPIYCRLGEQAFGTSPGQAELMFTLRATTSKDFESLKRSVINTVVNSINKTSFFNKIKMDYEWVEEFPNTSNDAECADIIREAASLTNSKIEEVEFPFRWSEDFGHFTEKYPGAIFGLGAGINQPALHNPNYDFPDQLIDTGVKMFEKIYKTILK